MKRKLKRKNQRRNEYEILISKVIKDLDRITHSFESQTLEIVKEIFHGVKKQVLRLTHCKNHDNRLNALCVRLMERRK